MFYEHTDCTLYIGQLIAPSKYSYSSTNGSCKGVSDYKLILVRELVV